MTEPELRRLRRHNIGRLATVLATAFQGEVLDRLRGRGHPSLRASHNAVLMNIDSLGTRQSIIAGRAGVTRQAISQIVDDLEQLGYVVRTSDPHDGRVQCVCFTARGKALLDEGVAIIAELEAQWASRLGPGELEAARTTLARLAGDLGIDLPE
jgi:DNA-binding MarR family transcriptional regulator